MTTRSCPVLKKGHVRSVKHKQHEKTNAIMEAKGMSEAQRVGDVYIYTSVSDTLDSMYLPSKHSVYLHSVRG